MNGLCMVMCQCRFTDCNKCISTTWCEVLMVGKVIHVCGQGIFEKSA